MSNLNATLNVDTDTKVDTFDRAHPGLSGVRVAGIEIGDLTLYFFQSDADIAAVTSRLISALRELREAAETRMAEPLPTADDVLGILAEPAVVWTEPELREAYGR